MHGFWLVIAYASKTYGVHLAEFDQTEQAFITGFYWSYWTCYPFLSLQKSILFVWCVCGRHFFWNLTAWRKLSGRFSVSLCLAHSFIFSTSSNLIFIVNNLKTLVLLQFVSVAVKQWGHVLWQTLYLLLIRGPRIPIHLCMRVLLKVSWLVLFGLRD